MLWMKKMKKILLGLLLSYLPVTQIYASTDIDIVNQSIDDSKTFLDLSDTLIDKEFDAAQYMLASKNIELVPGHFFVIVDRGVNQLLMIIYPHSKDEWELIASSHVSTGKPGRKEHFKTPTGVFQLDGSILDYRAEGTFNQNHIRGIGLKGSRVWDFGWQTTEDWRTQTDTMKIRMEMHATDPANLEYRIGRADSEGCIRIPSKINKLLDINGILDQHPNDLVQEGDRAWKALLGKNHKYLQSAGDTVIIVDVK